MSTSSLSVDHVVGETLCDYKVEQLLGRGNLNAVYLARQQGSSRAVMLTAFLLPSTFSSQARMRFNARFTIIASNLLQLHHPYIQPVEDFGEHDGLPYMVSPLVNGHTLSEIMRTAKHLTPLQISRILRRMGEALDYAHDKGIAHGALRPLNVWLDERKLQVVGFGLMPLLAQQGLVGSDHPYAHLLSVTGSFLGAPEYIAPEVVQGQAINPLSDVYGLGALAFEMLCGRPPFTDKDPFALAHMHVEQPIPPMSQFRDDVPETLELVVRRALANKPEERYHSAGEFAESFTRVVKLLEVPQEERVTGGLLASSFSGPLVSGPLTSGPLSWGGVPPRPRTGRLSTTSHSMPAIPHKIHWQLVPPAATTQLEETVLPTALMAQEKCSTAVTLPLSSGASHRDEATKSDYEHVQNSFATVPMTPVTDKVAIQTLGEIEVTGGEACQQSMLMEKQAGPMRGGKWLRTAKSRTREASERMLKRGLAAWKRQNESKRRRMLIVLATAILVLLIGGVGLAFASRATPQQASGTRHVVSEPAPTSTAMPEESKSASTPASTPAPEESKSTPVPTNTPEPAQKKVIGNTNQAYGTAQTFTNPEDGKPSLLIRMYDGNFVAYESNCTIDGGQLTYDAASNKLVCGADGSVFDPANNGSVVSGPATTPRKQIPVIVNPDGTVTVG